MYAYNLLNLNADLKDQPIKIAFRVHLHITFNRVLSYVGKGRGVKICAKCSLLKSEKRSIIL